MKKTILIPVNKRKMQSRQQILAIEFTLIKQFGQAIQALKTDINLGNAVPEIAWMRIAHASVQAGKVSELSLVFEALEKEIPRRLLFSCAKNALRRGDAVGALNAYKKAEAKKIPKTKIAKTAKQFFEELEMGTDDYVSVCTDLGLPFPKDLLEKTIVHQASFWRTTWYVRAAQLLGQVPDQKVLKNHFDYYLEHFDITRASIALALLEEKPNEKLLKTFARKAFEKGQIQAGKHLIEMIIEN